MLITNHPDDERLSALAARDDDASADADLVAHVDACTACADLVAELGTLRSSLAALPDIAPPRPLRLLPTVEPEGPGVADRLGGWARRLFAPALTAGVALAMVGLVGTAAPALEGMAGGADAGTAFERADLDEADPDAYAADGAEAGAEQPGGEPAEEQRVLGTSDRPTSEEGEVDNFDTAGSPAPAGAEPPEDGSATASLPAQRSPWPMVLFTGVALAIGALLLRWILVPRPG